VAEAEDEEMVAMVRANVGASEGRHVVEGG